MKNLKSWGYLAIITLLWWGVLYPEFSLTAENIRMVDENGTVYECEISDYEAAQLVMNANGENVIIKSRLLEWLKEWSFDTNEEGCTD